MARPKEVDREIAPKGGGTGFLRPPARFGGSPQFPARIGWLASCDVEIYELLLEIRNVLTPLTLLEDSFIVRRVKEEIADAHKVTNH